MMLWGLVVGGFPAYRGGCGHLQHRGSDSVSGAPVRDSEPGVTSVSGCSLSTLSDGRAGESVAIRSGASGTIFVQRSRVVLGRESQTVVTKSCSVIVWGGHCDPAGACVCEGIACVVMGFWFWSGTPAHAVCPDLPNGRLSGPFSASTVLRARRQTLRHTRIVIPLKYVDEAFQ
jgi:hypothetical protein